MTKGRLEGKNVIPTKGAIHYLTMREINENRGYLEDKINKNKDIITLILGGPTKHYKYTKENIQKIYSKLNNNINKKHTFLRDSANLITLSENIITGGRSQTLRNHTFTINLTSKLC